MALTEPLHILNATVAICCLIGFSPAIVHARDNVDRLYLIGGATILVAVVAGSIARLHEPPTFRSLLILAAQVIWIVSAYLSRKRRRDRLSSATT